MKLVPLIALVSLSLSARQTTRFSAAAEATKAADAGFTGRVELAGYYSFHAEEDLLWDSTPYTKTASINLVFLPYLDRVPRKRDTTLGSKLAVDLREEE